MTLVACIEWQFEAEHEDIVARVPAAEPLALNRRLGALT